MQHGLISKADWNLRIILFILLQNIYATKTQRRKDECSPKVSICVLKPLWQFVLRLLRIRLGNGRQNDCNIIITTGRFGPLD